MQYFSRVLIIAKFLLIFLFVSALFAAGKQDNYNVVLISIDTLRADHLACYGYPRETSPNLDKLAKEGILFEQAISQATWTLPAHASIFTSRYVPVHGVSFFNRLDSTEVTLAEVLKAHGYRTAAFTGHGHVRAFFGFDQGFDIFNDEAQPLGMWARSFKHTVPLAINWVKANKNTKFFLFLHGYDVHEPFYSPRENIFDAEYKGRLNEINFSGLWWRMHGKFFLSDNDKLIEFSPQDISHIIAHYDGGIRYADEKIGEFLEELKKLGLWDNTIIVVLSDHGEELFERGCVSRHGYNFYDEVIHVPLIFRVPHIKNRGIRISRQAQLIDVMPTIFDFLGIPKNAQSQGNSLIPLINNTASPDFNEFVFSEISVVRTLEWKGIGYHELYNLKEDPHELNNLAMRNPEMLLRLNRELIKWRERGESLIEKKLIMQNEDSSSNDKEKFRDVGYWP